MADNPRYQKITKIIAKSNFLYNTPNSDVSIKKIYSCLTSVASSQYAVLPIFFNRSVNLRNLFSSITSITFSLDGMALMSTTISKSYTLCDLLLTSLWQEKETIINFHLNALLIS